MSLRETDSLAKRGSPVSRRLHQLSCNNVPCTKPIAATPQIAFARRVAPLFALSGVAPQSQTPIKGYAPSSLLAQTKNQQQRGPFQYFNSLLGETTPQEG